MHQDECRIFTADSDEFFHSPVHGTLSRCAGHYDWHSVFRLSQLETGWDIWTCRPFASAQLAQVAAW